MAKFDRDRWMRALKHADANGDDEDAKKIAEAIRKIDAQNISVVRRLGAGTSVGVAGTVGATVDIVSAMLGAFGLGHEEPLGGSRSIQRGLAALGLSVAPGEEENLGRAGRVGEVIGTVAAAGPALVAGGLKSAAKAAVPHKIPGALSTRQIVPRNIPGALSTRQPGTGSAVIQDIAETAVRSPKGFVAGEVTAATSAGLLGFEAAQRFPDEPGVQAMAEVIGGFGPIAAVTTVKVATKVAVFGLELIPFLGKRIVGGVRSFVSALTPTGSVTRAEARVRRSFEGLSEDIATRVGRKDVLEGAPLTAAQKTEEAGLLALERSIMESTPELSLRRQGQLAEVNETIRNAMLEPVREIPTAKVKDYLGSLLDTRISMAAARAEERLAELGTKATREDINRIAREELLSAKSAARLQETQLHNSYPQNARVPTTVSQEAYNAAKLDLSQAQRADLSKEARRALDPGKPTKEGKPSNKNFLGDETEVKELRGLQSKLREEARTARKDGKFNKARIADEIAEAITDDIADAAGGPEVREAVDVAVAFSRDLNTRFTRGAVGKLLGREGAGGVKTPESLTLETTVGARGPRAKVDTDALLEAVRVHVPPEIAARAGFSGDEAVMRGHIEGFLIADFRRSAVDGGQVDVKAAQRWLSENQDVMARFPELRRSMERARVASEEFSVAELAANPKISRAAVFIKAPPGKEIERVINTAKPKEAMEELVALARTDTTGQAEEGLKAAFLNFLLRRSEVASQLTAVGARPGTGDIPFVSGSKMTKAINDPAVFEAMQGLYTRAELGRINKIRQTALVLDRARGTSEAGEGIIGDEPNTLFSILGRVGGAQLGRMLARITGGGTVQTPGILAAHTKKLMISGVRDPASALLTDAIGDEKLFKALLLPLDKPANVSIVRAKLNAWVLDVLIEQHEFDDEEK